jgi:hypothetical protein
LAVREKTQRSVRLSRTRGMTGPSERADEASSASIQAGKPWRDPKAAAPKSGSRERCLLLGVFMSNLWLVVADAR